MLSTQIVDNLVNRADFYGWKARSVRAALKSGIFYTHKKTHKFIDLPVNNH